MRGPKTLIAKLWQIISEILRTLIHTYHKLSMFVIMNSVQINKNFCYCMISVPVGNL